MQLSNAVVGALLAATAMAAPRPHGAEKRGSSVRSRARQFSGNNAWSGVNSFKDGGNKHSSSSTTTAAAAAATTSTSVKSKTSSTSSAASAASTASTSVVESSSSSSFSSLTAMSNDQWAGAGYAGLYNSGETLQGVSATFNVMDASVPTDADTSASDFYASAWIGIDGQESCTEISDAGLWQAGVDSYIDSTGTQSFYAWYEWYPAGTVVIDIGTISAGDLISLNLTASSGTTGSIVIENTSTGESFSKTVTSSNEMCLDTVEWIMEDVSFDSDSTGLASFTPLTFADATWTTDAGTYAASGANERYEITDRTETTVSGETVVVTYL